MRRLLRLRIPLRLSPSSPGRPPSSLQPWRWPASLLRAHGPKGLHRRDRGGEPNGLRRRSAVGLSGEMAQSAASRPSPSANLVAGFCPVGAFPDQVQLRFELDCLCAYAEAEGELRMFEF